METMNQVEIDVNCLDFWRFSIDWREFLRAKRLNYTKLLSGDSIALLLHAFFLEIFLHGFELDFAGQKKSVS